MPGHAWPRSASTPSVGCGRSPQAGRSGASQSGGQARPPRARIAVGCSLPAGERLNLVGAAHERRRIPRVAAVGRLAVRGVGAGLVTARRLATVGDRNDPGYPVAVAALELATQPVAPRRTATGQAVPVVSTGVHFQMPLCWKRPSSGVDESRCGAGSSLDPSRVDGQRRLGRARETLGED